MSLIVMDFRESFSLVFQTPQGKTRQMELIWGNRELRAGQWKHLKFFGIYSFPHYVVNGGPENVGCWHDESVDLQALSRELWGDPQGARLVECAIFCDTDQTGAESIAYFSSVRLERAEKIKEIP